MQTGRPKKYKDPEKRRKTVKLNERAALILDQVRKKRPGFDLSRYLSEHLIKDFETPENWLKEQLAENQKQIDALYKENNKIAEKIRQIKEQTQHEKLQNTGR